MSLPAFLLVHSVTVKPYAGRSSRGVVYGTPFTLKCMAQGGSRIVKAADGTDKVASLTLYAAHGQASAVPALSQVTWGAVTGTVLASYDRDSGGLAGDAEHTEVVCE